MARVVTISRYAADDRRGDPTNSPFRSPHQARRYIGAQEMVMKRLEEIEGLEALLAETTDRRTRSLISLRLRASRANLASWDDYVDDTNCEREPKAVITTRD